MNRDTSVNKKKKHYKNLSCYNNNFHDNTKFDEDLAYNTANNKTVNTVEKIN